MSSNKLMDAPSLDAIVAIVENQSQPSLASLHLSSIRLKKYRSMLFVRSLIWSQKTFCHRLSVQKFL